jgi:hypothetical protein
MLGACARLHTGSDDGDWPSVLAGAQARAAGGDFSGADSLLARYATRQPATHEALETTYWRALFRLDPSNSAVSMPVAIASLDAYLHDPRPRDHVAEAQTLRRAAAQIDALNRAADAASAQAASASTVAANAKAAAADAKADAKTVDATAIAAAADKDAEIKHLKDELTKANTELDRIKKRLGTPPPSKP